MSRLDQHVASVQNKLALARFVDALARTTLIFACALLAGILFYKLFQVGPPKASIWIWAGLGAAIVAAIIWAIIRRPGAHAAAVAIDQKFSLKEKLSTALYVRPSSDEFAAAAVRDAEHTAEKVSIDFWRHFPIRFPRVAYATLAVALVALVTARYMSPLDLFGREQERKKHAQQQARSDEARKTVESALATVNSVPKSVADAEAIKLARADLQNLLNQPIKDADQAKRSALKALQDVSAAIKRQIDSGKEFAQAQNDARMFKQLQQPATGEGPVADAQRAMAKGDFTEAMTQLEQLVEKFDKMDEAAQKQAAEQMKQLSQALQQMAQDPNVQKQVQQQLQNAGMNQQQAQQAQQLMQQAAQGDKQAQQQLQQMAQQMMQQMNNGQGPTQQQQQQLQQMMQQMQAQMNSQQTAQQMQQAAQQMARAMQQAAQQQQQQGQQQQGQNQGQNAQQQQQQMQQAMQGMQQQLQQMQAAAQDAQQIGAAQQQAAQAQQGAQDAINGKGAQAGGNDPGNWGGNNAQAQNNPGQWNGQPGQGDPNQGGIGAGDRTFKQQAPFAVKKEVSQSQDNEEGKILASNFIKDNKPIRGESKLSLQEIARSAQKEQTDEVDNERVSRSAQKVVREYFKSMEDDAAAAPSTAPSN